MAINKMTELQQKLKAIMLEHLKTKGYPNITMDQIMAELKPMWIKLEESGLLPSGVSFNNFVQSANARYIFQQMMDNFRI